MVAGPTGSTVEYVVDEVIFRPADQADLDTFLTRYGGVVLRDGTVPAGDVAVADANVSSGSYLIKIDTSTSTVDDLSTSLGGRNVGGHYSFSSERAAATASVLARETGRDLRPNFLFAPTAITEHPDDSGGFLDAETWPWLTEDDDTSTPGDQGLSVGVTHAWEYLDYIGVRPENGSFSPPRIAIIDGGFALDDLGNPSGGNLDFFPARPEQYDLVDYDGSAGGENLMSCGGSACPWHGTGAFGTALARHGNQYGGAGTSGNYAWPILVRIDTSFYSIASGIRTSAIHGADVISLSLGGGCSVDMWICTVPPDDIYTTLQAEVDFAVTGGAVVLAAAGNDRVDIATDDFVPCELARVICVGSVDAAGQNVFNYGTGVDIWAPTNVYSTVSPATSAADANNIGVDELYRFGGTSASTPFVAGVVGLMKAIDPNIKWDRVQDILQQTANPSTDPRVTFGYLDAHRAVVAVADNNAAPTITITNPTANEELSYRARSFTAEAIDPGHDNPEAGVVVWSSDIDGELCRVQGFYYAGLATRCSPLLSLGTHVITATAIDPHGAASQDVVTVQAINHAPTVDVTAFPAGSSFFANQTIRLGALANDVDEGSPFDQTRLIWSSNLDGELGDGTGLEVSLSVGTHTLTATVTDELGLSAQDTTTVTIASGEGVPTVQILSPTVGAVGPDTPLTFRGSAIDPEDGALTGASLEWISSIDGAIGTGVEIEAVLSDPVVACNPETVRHTITLRVTDSDGNVVTETTQVSVGVIC